MKKLLFLFLIPFLMGADISSPPVDTSSSVQTQQYLQELYNNFNNLTVVTSDPNGSRYGKYGDLVAYNDGGTWNVKICTSSPSGTSWENVTATSTPSDSDEKVKVSSNDTTAGYLNGKLVAGTGITLTEGSDGGNETLTIAASGSDTNTSNIIYSWNGCEFYQDDSPAGMSGLILSTSLTDTTAIDGKYTYIRVYSSSYQTILTSQFVKIAGISTVTIHGKIWADTTGGTAEALLKVDIGGLNNTVKSVASATPTWVTVSTIDVSGLTNGTTYDITISLANESASNYAYVSGIILTAS